jgi:hypothetical protein
MEYAEGTSLELEPGPFACGYVTGRALCSDGKVRTLRFANGGIADTFFSIPARVNVGRKTVSGYATVETLAGFTTDMPDDPAVVKFVAYQYGRNAEALPRGAWKAERGI